MAEDKTSRDRDERERKERERLVAQGHQPDQPPDEVLQRYAGVPKTADELEADHDRVVEEGLHPRGAAQQTSEHPHGGPPGQTGEHPHGGPPGQTGEHPHGGPPGQAPEPEPKK